MATQYLTKLQLYQQVYSKKVKYKCPILEKLAPFRRLPPGLHGVAGIKWPPFEASKSAATRKVYKLLLQDTLLFSFACGSLCF